MSLLTFLWFALVLPASAWWNAEWTYRKKITLDTSSAGVPIGEAVSGAPVLLRLHDGNFQFAAAKDDGSDLRFVAADNKTVLVHHVERYDALLHEALVWVKVDVAANAPTTLWLYAGNSSEKATRTDDPKGTFDADTMLVYHFAENGGVANDASGHGHHAQNPGTPSNGAFIGGGLRLDGKAVNLPESPTLAWTTGGSFTWSAWLKPTLLQPGATIYARRDGASALVIGADGGVPFVEVNGQRSGAGAPWAVNSWHHLAVVASSQQIALFVDGEPYTTLAASLPALTTAAQLGADVAAGGVSFTGEIDELQFAKTARGGGCIKFAALGQGGEKAAKLVVFGADEAPSSWRTWLTSGTFGIILKNLTFDGWVVIVLCFFMAIMSWWVMLGKAKYLKTVTHGNALFFQAWKRLDADVAGFENGDDQDAVLAMTDNPASQRAVKKSPLYRIYNIGVEEIRHRFSLRPDQPKSLTSRAIQAIRATLDGGLVRETQKLNAKIVLLTICISGGPFLGLLGTVVGVMITFAAIAAAGDVNVNAIAPGIAAALLATIAGLGVAIPALFGYNYLLTRIKETTSDLHVFIDEFVTRMAEQYRGGPAE